MNHNDPLEVALDAVKAATADIAADVRPVDAWEALGRLDTITHYLGDYLGLLARALRKTPEVWDVYTAPEGGNYRPDDLIQLAVNHLVTGRSRLMRLGGDISAAHRALTWVGDRGERPEPEPPTVE